jgi:hypothetical protein
MHGKRYTFTKWDQVATGVPFQSGKEWKQIYLPKGSIQFYSNGPNAPRIGFSPMGDNWTHRPRNRLLVGKSKEYWYFLTHTEIIYKRLQGSMDKYTLLVFSYSVHQIATSQAIDFDL